MKSSSSILLILLKDKSIHCIFVGSKLFDSVWYKIRTEEMELFPSRTALITSDAFFFDGEFSDLLDASLR